MPTIVAVREVADGAMEENDDTMVPPQPAVKTTPSSATEGESKRKSGRRPMSATEIAVCLVGAMHKEAPTHKPLRPCTSPNLFPSTVTPTRHTNNTQASAARAKRTVIPLPKDVRGVNILARLVRLRVSGYRQA